MRAFHQAGSRARLSPMGSAWSSTHAGCSRSRPRPFMTSRRRAWRDGFILGIPDDYAEPFLPDIVGQFSRLHPLVDLSIVCHPSVKLAECIATGEIDLAVVTGCDRIKGVEILREEPLCWVAGARAGAVEDERPLPLALSTPSLRLAQRRLGGPGAIGHPVPHLSDVHQLCGLGADRPGGVGLDGASEHGGGRDGPSHRDDSGWSPAPADRPVGLILRVAEPPKGGAGPWPTSFGQPSEAGRPRAPCSLSEGIDHGRRIGKYSGSGKRRVPRSLFGTQARDQRHPRVLGRSTRTYAWLGRPSPSRSRPTPECVCRPGTVPSANGSTTGSMREPAAIGKMTRAASWPR